MPFINVRTNTAVSDTAEQAMKRQLGQAIEALPGKSEAWLMVNFEPEARLWFAGSDDAAAMVEVSASAAWQTMRQTRLPRAFATFWQVRWALPKTAFMSNMPRRRCGAGTGPISEILHRLLKISFPP